MPRRVRPRSTGALTRRLAELSLRLEKAQIAEYVEFMRSPRRVLYSNFLAGLARGFGIGIGATVLAAVFLYALSVVISLNLPIIGKFIADIVRIVEAYRT